MPASQASATKTAQQTPALKKTVTAILPNYNYAHYFPKRLQEILHQTYPVSELIILDDASTDDSQKIIQDAVQQLRQTHPKLQVKTLFNTKNSGNVFLQWQKGIKLASSDLIWLCELDDSATKDLLRTLVEPFRDSQVVLSYCDSKIVNENNKPILKDNLRRAKDFFRRKHAPGSYIADGSDELNKNLAIFNPIPNVSAAVIKNLPELPGILTRAKDYHLSGDWYFYIELAKLGRIAYSPRALNLHRIHQSSVTSQTSLSQRFAEIQAIHRHIETSTNLSAKAKDRIASLERDLRHRWHL